MTGITHDDPASPEPDDGVIRAELPGDLTAAGQARSAVRRALAAWGMDDPEGDSELLVSELVANAAEHGNGNPITVALHRNSVPAGITCEVTDTSPVAPTPRRAGPEDERGRGLAIIAALATASGVRPEPAGKTTWFTLALRDRIERAGHSAQRYERQAEAGA